MNVQCMKTRVCVGGREGEEYQNLMISEAPASAAAVYACILVRLVPVIMHRTRW